MTIKSAVDAPAPDAVTDPAIVDPALAAAATAATDANTADSSTVDVTDAKTPSLLDVVKSAIEPKVEPTDPSTVTADEVVPPVEDKALEAEADPANDADLPFHNHPRWKQVQAERDSFRDDAGQYGKITSYMRQHELTPENVAEGYEVMALIKSGSPEDLTKVLEYLETNALAVKTALGHVIPEDLQARVDDGLIDEAGAAELAKARAAEALRNTQSTARDEAAAAARATTDAQALGSAMVTAVEGWEARTRATDPDYAKKAELLETECRAIVQREGKVPTTPEEAVALAERAKVKVDGQFKALLPKPKAITPSPLSSSTPTNSAPKTLKEAIANAANGG